MAPGKEGAGGGADGILKLPVHHGDLDGHGGVMPVHRDLVIPGDPCLYEKQPQDHQQNGYDQLIYKEFSCYLQKPGLSAKRPEDDTKNDVIVSYKHAPEDTGVR